MNIKNISAFLVIMLLHVSTQAQEIKKQYKGSSDQLTTVVIKDEEASDYDILNEQFDLEEMGMHQVVRITTQGEAVIDDPKPQIPKQSPNVASVAEEEIITAKVEKPEVPVQQKQVKKEQKKIVKNAAANVGGTATTNKYTSKQSNRRSAFKPHYSKKRFKKKKRKKRRRNRMKRGRCYSF